jgi:hypothetical protein
VLNVAPNSSEIMKRTMAYLVHRRATMLTELCSVYPIDQVFFSSFHLACGLAYLPMHFFFPRKSLDDNSFLICGVKLGGAQSGVLDEDAVATALGFVAHLVLLIARNLEAPLRYPMVPMGSRPLIRDTVTQASTTE